MDPATLSVAALAFVGSCIAQKCTDASLEAAWVRIKAAFKRWRGSEATGQSVQSARTESQVDQALLSEAEAIFGRFTGLRRARIAESALKGARILWVDDQPENNIWERSLLRALDADATSVETTRSALACLARGRFDLILSDIARENIADEGLRALPRINAVAAGAPVLFYVGDLHNSAAPPGAFGITNEPNELLHLVLDVLNANGYEAHRLTGLYAVDGDDEIPGPAAEASSVV